MGLSVGASFEVSRGASLPRPGTSVAGQVDDHDSQTTRTTKDTIGCQDECSTISMSGEYRSCLVLNDRNLI